MKKCGASADHPEFTELEFPDWSGMDETSARIDPEAAFRLCECYAAWFPEWAEKCRAHAPEKCLTEFVL